MHIWVSPWMTIRFTLPCFKISESSPQTCHAGVILREQNECKQIPIFKRNVEQGHAVHQLLGWLWRQSGFGVAGQHKCPHICLIFVPYLQNKVSMTTSHLLLLSLATHGEFMGQQIEVSWASPWSTFMVRASKLCLLSPSSALGRRRWSSFWCSDGDDGTGRRWDRRGRGADQQHR